ncbi:hypothetical protein FKM82_014411 [Ascaphus truei]
MGEWKCPSVPPVKSVFNPGENIFHRDDRAMSWFSSLSRLRPLTYNPVYLHISPCHRSPSLLCYLDLQSGTASDYPPPSDRKHPNTVSFWDMDPPPFPCCCHL